MPTAPGTSYLRVADVAAEKAAMKAAGVSIVRQPEPTVHDMLEMEIVDPDGYGIWYAQDTAGV